MRRAVDIERRAVEAGTKIANRKQYVKIRTANAVQTTVGPWCVGVPDVIRLRGVYLGDVSVSTASQNVTGYSILTITKLPITSTWVIFIRSPVAV